MGTTSPDCKEKAAWLSSDSDTPQRFASSSAAAGRSAAPGIFDMIHHDLPQTGPASVQHRNRVEPIPVTRLAMPRYPHCRSRFDFAALARTDGFQWMPVSRRAPCPHLHERDQIAMPRYQINFLVAPPPVPVQDRPPPGFEQPRCMRFGGGPELIVASHK
jgi:hypothetical protein